MFERPNVAEMESGGAKPPRAVRAYLTAIDQNPSSPWGQEGGLRLKGEAGGTSNESRFMSPSWYPKSRPAVKWGSLMRCLPEMEGTDHHARQRGGLQQTRVFWRFYANASGWLTLGLSAKS
ncbi:MAG TPA: hypothetical protein VMU19_09680, partial [Bryobacteraceae bacterium]|nr:hypothetical protein [Bryobacteraceae bacterium]